MKKVLAMLGCVVMLCVVMCVSVCAECAEHSYISSVTAPTITTEGYTTYVCDSCGYSYVGDYTKPTGFATLDEGIEHLRSAMVNRETSVTVSFRGEVCQDLDYQKLFWDCLEHTGNPKEGDYLLTHFGGAGVSGETGIISGVNYMKLTYTLNWHTTAEMERELDEAIAALIEDLHIKNADDYTKVRAVYDYICKNMEYDYTGLAAGNNKLIYTAYAAMINNTAVCQGFASLFYRLCLELGVDCRVIGGVSEGEGHAWNIVKLGSVYYNLDSTWDLGMPRFGYRYFLCTENNFQSHERDPEYSTAEFYASYPMATRPYGVPCYHRYKTTVIAPTCTESGYTVYTCKICANNYTDDHTAPKGHDYSGTVTPATCTEQGYTYYVCTDCTDNYTGDYTDALGHTSVAIPSVAPTCTEDGLTEGSYCVTCGIVLEPQTAVPAMGHRPIEAVRENEIAATCAANGSYDSVVYCFICKYEISREKITLDATGDHFYETETERVEPTCTEDGYCVTVCVCGAEERTVIGALGHDFDATVTEPTCNEHGYVCYVCHCGYRYYADHGDALGHTDENGDGYCDRCQELLKSEHVHDHCVSEELAPGCTADGYILYRCSCGDEYIISTDALGHDFPKTFVTDKEATYESAGQKSRHCRRCAEKTDVTEVPMLIRTEKLYVDVKQKSWFREAVDYVVSNGFMNGTSADRFEPNTSMTRAMLVTVLWRIDGQPEPVGKSPFTDLKQAWYKKAVVWAYENNIVNGTDKSIFSPDGNITREQLAAILCRYAEYSGKDVSAKADISVYPDAKKVSKYARDAMGWANAEELITGTPNAVGTKILDPRGNATRAQVATIFKRFLG